MPTISSLKEIKRGVVIIFKDAPYQVLESEFSRMQSAKPVMQTKMRNLVTGAIFKHNFSHGDKPELAEITRKKASFLYKDGAQYMFMDNETYDQSPLDTEAVGDKRNYLTEGLEVELQYWREQLISIDLPPKVTLKVTETEPAVRGDTAQGSVTKPATLETGYTLQVPIFVKQDDKIKVNTETGEYTERV